MIDVKWRWSGDNALRRHMPMMIMAEMVGVGFNLAAAGCKEQAAR